MTTARERILKAAVTLFSDYGFSGTTTKRIAAKAKVNEVTLFRLFGSKKNLLSEVIRQYSSNSVIDENFREKITWDLKNDLTAIGTSFMEMTMRNIHTILMIITEARRNRAVREIAAAPPREHNRMLAWYLDEQISLGNCRKIPDTLAAAQSFFALFFEYSINTSLDRKKDTDVKPIIETYVDLFLNGITDR